MEWIVIGNGLCKAVPTIPNQKLAYRDMRYTAC